MPTLKRIAQQLGSADGAEILEAAIVLPLVFLFLLGIVEFGRAFNIYSTIQQAAQQGAITAARESCATCGDAPAVPAAADTAISNVMLASSVQPSQAQLWEPNNSTPGNPTPTVPSCPSPAPPTCSATSHNFWVCSSVLLNSSEPTQCGAMVSFQYPFQFNLPFTSLNMSTITLSAQAQSRMED